MAKITNNLSSPAKPAKKPILREVAFTKFQDHLFAGKFQPGQMLTQAEISDILGVHIGPLREALKRLEADDIVTIRPQSGIVIQPIDIKQMDDLFEYRKILECEAARRFAKTCDVRVVRDLRSKTESILDQFGASQDEWVAGFRHRADVDFLLHDTIIDSYKNEVISKEFRRISNKMRIFRLAVYFQNQRNVPGLEEHLHILSALEHRNSEAAADAMRLHLENARRRSLGITP